jgi:NADH dehydrogenase subunit 5 C-terminus.
MVETSYNMASGMVGLLVISIIGSRSLMSLICPTPSVICLPYYLKFPTLLVVFIGGWIGYGLAGIVLGGSLFYNVLFWFFFICWFYMVYIIFIYL